MSPAGLEPAIPANDRTQTHPLDLATHGFGYLPVKVFKSQETYLITFAFMRHAYKRLVWRTHKYPHEFSEVSIHDTLSIELSHLKK
jgi:hypothetical protein